MQMDETAEAEEPGNSVEPKQDVDEGVSEEEDAFLWYKCLEVWWKMEDILPSSSFGPFVKKHPSFSKDPEHRIVGGFLFRGQVGPCHWKGGLPRQRRIRSRDAAPDKLSVKGSIFDEINGSLIINFFTGYSSSPNDDISNGAGSDEASGSLGHVDMSQEPPLTLEELHDAAAATKDAFEDFVIKVARKAGLDVSKQVSFPAMKSRDACHRKAVEDYGGDYSCVVDVVRCSIVAHSTEELTAVADTFECLKLQGFEVVRFKNRFFDENKRAPLLTMGYRDALFSIAVETQPGVAHVCEVQLHLQQIKAKEKLAYPHYVYFRRYLQRSATLANSTTMVREDMLVRIVKAAIEDMQPKMFWRRHRRHLEAVKKEVIETTREDELEVLADLFDLINEFLLSGEVRIVAEKKKQSKRESAAALSERVHSLQTTTKAARRLAKKYGMQDCNAVRLDDLSTIVEMEIHQEPEMSSMEINSKDYAQMKSINEYIVRSKYFGKIAAEFQQSVESLTHKVFDLRDFMSLSTEVPESLENIEDLLQSADAIKPELDMMRMEYQILAAESRAKGKQYGVAKSMLKTIIDEEVDHGVNLEKVRSSLTGVMSADLGWQHTKADELMDIDKKIMAYKTILRSYYFDLGMSYEKGSPVGIITEKLEAARDIVMRKKYDDAVCYWTMTTSQVPNNDEKGVEPTLSTYLKLPERREDMAESRKLLLEILEELEDGSKFGDFRIEYPTPTASKIALVCNALGFIEFHFFSAKRAQIYLLRSLRYLEERFGENHAKVAQACIFVGDAAMKARWLGKARAYYRRALWIGVSLSDFKSSMGIPLEKSLNEKPKEVPSMIVASAYRALGKCAKEMGDYEEAKRMLRQALDTFIATGLAEEDHECLETTQLLNEVGRTSYSRRMKAGEISKPFSFRIPTSKKDVIDLFSCKRQWMLTNDPEIYPYESFTAWRKITEEQKLLEEAEAKEKAKEEMRIRKLEAELEKKRKENEYWVNAADFEIDDLCTLKESKEDIEKGAVGIVREVKKYGKRHFVEVEFPSGETYKFSAPELEYVHKTWENYYRHRYNPMLVQVYDWATDAIVSLPH